MKNNTSCLRCFFCCLFVLATTGLYSVSALASGTDAGTIISNFATLDFSIGGVVQGDIVSSPTGNDNPDLISGDAGAEATSFMVDRKLDLLVTTDNNDHVLVTPGQATAALAYIVTNQSNAVSGDLSIKLMAVHSKNPTGFAVGVDNFDVKNNVIKYYIDSNKDKVYDAADIELPTVDGVATLANVNPDVSYYVLVVADIDTVSLLVDGNVGIADASGVNGSISALSLVAQVAETDDTIIDHDNNDHISPGSLAISNFVDDQAVRDDVFADNRAIGDTTLVTRSVADTISDEDLTYDFVLPGGPHEASSSGKDVPSNGQASDTSAFKIATAVIDLKKSVVTFCDDINGTSNPKSIPGAYKRYSLTVTNATTATASAQLSILKDTLQAVAITFDADLLDGSGVPSMNVCAGSRATNAGGQGFRVSCGDVVPTTTGLDRSARSCVATPAFFTSINDADGADHNGDTDGGLVSLDYTKLLRSDSDHKAGELAPGESVTVEFQVRIN